MQRLEALVGVPLFHKEGRNKALTPAALQLLGHARELLRINDDAIQSTISGAQAGEYDTLRLVLVCLSMTRRR